jgi:predicted flap endonuclease-1-like 5' DNA nuclease
MSKKRPLGITILAVLVAIAAIIAVYHTLQFLHILPFSLGPVRFFAFDLLGALLWGLTAFILIWLVNKLWNLDPQGWLFVVVMAVFDLILAFVSILGQSTLQALLPAILINAIILIYCLLPGVKAAFMEPAKTTAPIAAPTAVRTMEVPSAAPVPTPAVRSAAVPLEAAPAEPVAQPIVTEIEEPTTPPIETSAEEPLVPPAVEPVSEEPAAPPPVELSVEEKAAPVSVEVSPAPAPHSTRPRPKVDIETIEGIGPAYAAKLKAVGILTTAELLQMGASRKGREELVEKTGVSAKLILKWVNMADLMRISGIGEEYSELLEAAGVDTVKELKMRNPDNLHQAMLQVNEQRKLVRRAPHLSEVRDWVEQAKQIEAVITY